MENALRQFVGKLFITYNQIAVFQEGLENPFNDWGDSHVEQGFAWREESVSFASVEDGVECAIYMKMADHIEVHEDAVRAIIVPFAIGENAGVEIATITDSLCCGIQAGKYNVLFQTGCHQGDDYWCSFTFVPAQERIFRIVKNDGQLSRTEDFDLTAKPA